MADRYFDIGANSDDVPWASVFDPAANARALSAIQAEGFRAASRLVDRFTRMAEESGGDTGRPEDAGLEQMTRTWWSAFGRFLLGGAPGGQAPAPDLDVWTPDDGRGVILHTVAPGRVATEVWLHNRSTTDFGDVRLRCSDLLAHDGRVITSDRIRLEPAGMPMPARCSRGIAMEVEVGSDACAGVYRGNLLVADHSDLWLAVMLTVARRQP